MTQNPADVPEDILGQLGNRIQHALRAFTPRDQKALRMAAETFRENPDFNTADAIKEVGVGEALVSTLEKKGMPSVVQRTLIRPPSSQLGPITADERKSVIAGSPVAGLYEAEVDRESAEEILKKRADMAAAEAEAAEKAEAEAEEREKERVAEEREFNSARRYDGGSSGGYKRTTTTRSRSSRSDSIGEAFAKSFARQLGTKAGQTIIRGVLGSLFKGR